MDSNIFGLAVSFVFLGVVIGIAVLLRRFTGFSSEFIRKFIHIGVSNWWFILMAWMDNIWYAIIGPVVFIILNSVMTFGGYGGFLGMDDKKRNYGLIYFPISLLVLVLLVYNGKLAATAATVGVLSMGYGDGLAAMVGHAWGKKKLPFLTGGKTWLGTAVMFLVVTLVAYLFASVPEVPYRLLVAVTTGLVGAFLEAATPLGLDNVTVPLGVALWVAVLC
jgi:phytol kinase